MQNYGKWKMGVAAYGGMSGQFYAGIYERTAKALTRFGYLEEAGGSVWSYGTEEDGAGSCAAVTECPSRQHHKQSESTEGGRAPCRARLRRRARFRLDFSWRLRFANLLMEPHRPRPTLTPPPPRRVHGLTGRSRAGLGRLY